MARSVANVDILTETFEAWLLKTNGLLHSLSTEIVTANSTWGYTGNTSVPRQGQLVGTFAANAVFVGEVLSGGRANSTPGSNATVSANLNIVSNVNISGVTVNSAANSRYTNTAFFEANVQANGALFLVTPDANTAFLITPSSAILRSNNVTIRSNTTFTAFNVVGNGTTTNTTIAGNNLNISANLVVSSLNHTVAGNTNFDSGTMFVDGTNNRVGIMTTTPDTELTVVGSANVVGNTWVGDRFTAVGNSAITSGIVTVTTNPSLANVVTVVAANVNIDSGALFVDQVTNRTGINTTTPDASLQVVGQANVSGVVRLANTLAVIGNTTLSNTLAVTGNTTLSNTLSVAGNVQFNSAGLHTIAGNVNFDTGTLFVDAVNNRIGVNNTAPDAAVTVNGAANVSSAVWVGGNTNLATGIIVVNSNTISAANTVAITGANVNIDAGTLFVDQFTNRVGINTITPDASLQIVGQANVSGATRLANTLTVIGATTLSNTLLVTGAANVLSTFGVTGAVNALSTLGVVGLTTLAGNVNTTVANASVAINVGANVSVNTIALVIGNVAGVSSTTTATQYRVRDITTGQTTVITPTVLRIQRTYTDGANNRQDVTQVSNTEMVIVAGEDPVDANVFATKIVANTSSLRISNSSVNTEVSTGQVRVGANVISNTTTIRVGNSSVSVTAGVDGTLAVTNAATFANTLQVVGAANALSTFGVTGLTTLLGNVNTTVANASIAVNVGANVTANTTTIRVGNASVFSAMTNSQIATTGTLSVAGNTSLQANVTVGGTLEVPTLRVTSGLVLEGDYAIDIASNANIGTSTSTPILIYQFARADYRTGKLMVQVTNGANTQMSEMVIAHNNTDAYITIYGTVSSPPGANNFNALLGNFTSSINSTSNAVELFLQQTQANSAVKVVAHLVK